jgi:signal transduction histidine kinase
MNRPRLGVRTRLLATIVGVVALALILAVTAFTVLLTRQLSANATSRARAQAEAELSALEVRGGTIVTRETLDEGALDSQVWVFAGGRIVEAPSRRRVAPTVHDLARSLANGPERFRDLKGSTRLYALPVVEGGTRYGTVVSAVSLEPYEQTRNTALTGALILAGLLLVAITVLSRWMLGRAFRPVSRMTADAAAWSEHDIDRRFDVGEPYDEITRLAATLDVLLTRIAASLRHEQRFTAELSHELRTPLARIAGESDLMLRRDRSPDEYRSALAAIGRNADEMTRTVDALVAAARHEAGLSTETCDARGAVRQAVDNVRPHARSVDLHLTLPPEPARIAADQDLIERMIQPLIDNAVRYGRSAVDVSLVRGGATAMVRVVDDGPGVAPEEAAEIFEPGARGDAATGRADGAGLGLSLARRLARSAGGEITVRPGTDGGDFTLALPLARRT